MFEPMSGTGIEIRSSYGLVLFLDPQNQLVEVPETGSSTPSWTSSCLAVPVRPFVDGSVRVILGTSPDMGEVVFSGKIVTPSGALAIELPENQDPVLQVGTGSPTAEVTVAVDDADSPSMLWLDVAVE